MEKQYRLANLIGGWFVFAVSSLVYILTMEPTVSFWDCGEFISTAFKLEVGHPPGAPFFMLMGRFFSLFAASPQHVAVMINAMSALASGFTIMFLFWTITHLAKKIVCKNINTANIIAVISTGLIGSLAYTFSDTFWFSAVEGEVYATSSLFTAIVFWAILKWENEVGQKHATRWLILIAYLMGLSIGVHLLNLLAIPAIVLVYYFKQYNYSHNGLVKALALSALLLGIVMYGIIQGMVSLAAKFELLFVNGFGLSYNSGLAFFLLALSVFIIWLIYDSQRKGRVWLNTIAVAFAFIMIGYSSFALIVIRSAAQPPMDQNNPENLFNLLSYLNREQYGDRPLLYGEYYNAPAIGTKEKNAVYTPLDDKYVETNRKFAYTYDSRFQTIFPRMYSSQKDHVEIYKKFGKIKGKKIRIRDEQGERVEIVPSFIDNIRFFVSYQLGFMYFRYFMWNFAGRQNDIQGFGNKIHGNWICGIPFIDQARLGSQDKLPSELARNKGRNRYFLLPLILGIVGMIYHYKKHKKDSFVVFMLFILTGVAIVIYLNQTPNQPRERDYAYAGSFYAFCIWVGVGVLALFDFLSKRSKHIIAASAALLLSLPIPAILAIENWDDHDRSHRYTARDFSYNYLNSCAPNAIIFTNGDNDTFPLWYLQEVEGVRTDVRVTNLSYIGADWYIDQMKRKAYESEALPISLSHRQYLQGTRDVVYLHDKLNKTIELKQAINFVASDDPRTKLQSGRGEKIDYIPSKLFRITVDTAIVFANGTVSRSKANKVVPALEWKINRNYIIKNDLIVLDLLATNNWERPIYFAITVSNDNYLGLENYFELHGMAYRLVPIQYESQWNEIGGINTDIMYEKLMHKFRWGNANDPRVYLNEDNRRMLINYRSLFGRLAKELLAQGKQDSAIQVLDKCMEIMPQEQVPYKYFILSIAEGYFSAGQPDKALQILRNVINSSKENLDYYISIREKADDLDYEKRLALYIMQESIRISQKANYDDFTKEIDDTFRNYAMIISPTLKER